MGLPQNLVDNVKNQVVWQFASEADILALPVEARHFNVRYTDGSVWYKCVVQNGTKVLIKDTDGAILSVIKGDGTKVTRTGSEVKVEVDRSTASNNAFGFDQDGKAIVKYDEIDQDSTNLLEYVTDEATGIRKLKMKALARREFKRTAAADLAAFISAEYQAGITGNVQPGDMLLFVNSTDPAEPGYNQVRSSYECVGTTGNATDFVTYVQPSNVQDAARQAISSDSTFVTYNPATGKINHLFSTAARNALKLGQNGGGEVIVGEAIVNKVDGTTELSVEQYLHQLEQQGVSNANSITTLQQDLQTLSENVDARLDALEAVSYEQGVIKEGDKVKAGGSISESRTTTFNVAGSHDFVSSSTNVGSLMKLSKSELLFGNNVVFEIGKGRWWKDAATGTYYKIDFDINTGAEFLVNGATLPN